MTTPNGKSKPAVAETALETVQNTAIAQYGERDVIRELVDRLMKFHPASREVGSAGMLQAAQLAVLMGASPLPATNEIHIWKDNRSNVNVVPGINYWRRRANAVGFVMLEQPRPMNEEEHKLYGIDPKGDIGAICKGILVSDLQKIKQLTDVGFSQTEARQGVTKIGVGVVSKRLTKHGAYSEAAAGRPLSWKAQKRAETDLYKKLAPFVPGEQFPAGAGMRQDEQGAYTVNNGREWGSLDVVIEDEPQSEPIDLNASNDDLFGPQSAPPPPDIEEGELIEEPVAVAPEPAPPTEQTPAPMGKPKDVDQPLRVWNFAAHAMHRYPYFSSPFKVTGALNKMKIALAKQPASELERIMSLLGRYANMRADGVSSDEAAKCVLESEEQEAVAVEVLGEDAVEVDGFDDEELPF